MAKTKDIHDVIQAWCLKAAIKITEKPVKILGPKNGKEEPGAHTGTDEIDETSYSLDQVLDLYYKADKDSFRKDE